MEPNKLEKQFREQLHSREIKPSETAWDRLDAMLSVAEEKKTKRPFGWLYIAASILVLVTAGTFFFNQEDTEVKSENKVVVNDTIEINNSIKPNVLTGKNEIIQNNINPIQNQKQIVQIVNQKQQSSEKNQVSIITREHSSNWQNNQKRTVNPIINQVEDKAITQNEAIHPKETDVNVDDLLSSAQKTLRADKKIIIKVNPTDLLSQVDGELDQTFREKVVSRINKNYKEVKVALESRNQK